MNSMHQFWPVDDRSFRACLQSMHRTRVLLTALKGAELFTPGSDARETEDLCGGEAASVIDGSRERVWPWIAQMFRGAGIYSAPGLETNTCRSADYLLVDTPAPTPGDHVGEMIEICRAIDGEAVDWRGMDTVEFLGFPITELSLRYSLASAGEHRCILTASAHAECAGVTAQVRRHIGESLVALFPVAQARRLGGMIAAQEARLERGRTNHGRIDRHQALPWIPAGSGERSGSRSSL